jgi:hypothetical protein
MCRGDSASPSPCPGRPRAGLRAGSRACPRTWPRARALATLLLGLSAAGCTPTFDVSGADVFHNSFLAIIRQLDAAEQDKLRSAICYLATNGEYGSRHAAEVKGVGKSVKGTLFASTDIVGTIVTELGFQEIGGKTATQVIDAAQSQSMKYFHRPPPPVEDQLGELKGEMHRDIGAEVAALERDIAPEQAKLKSQSTLVASTMRARLASYSAESGKAVLRFDIDNLGPMTIRAVQLDVAFAGRDAGELARRRLRPLRLEQDLGPGQTQHLRIVEPRATVAAGAVPDPADVADVAVTVTNALLSDGAWIVTVDIAKLDKQRKDAADLRAAERRASDNLDAMAALLQ